jgi:hypothetical protein
MATVLGVGSLRKWDDEFPGVERPIVPLEGEGQLLGIAGQPGTGKSVLSTGELQRLWKAGKLKRVLTNSPLVPEKWPDELHIVFLTNHEIAARELAELRDGDAFLVDESHLCWHPEAFKRIRKETDLETWVSQARKLGVHFVIISQSYADFVVFVRRRLQYVWMCFKLGPLRWSWQHTNAEGGLAEKSGWFPRLWFTFVPPACVAMFNSRQLVGTGPGKAVQRQSHGWKYIGFFVGALVFSLALCWWKWGFLLRAAYGTPVVPGAVAATKPAARGAGAGAGVVPMGGAGQRGSSYETYIRRDMRFVDAFGVVADPVSGLRGREKNDVVGQWDAVEAQIGLKRGDESSGPAGEPKRAGRKPNIGM